MDDFRKPTVVITGAAGGLGMALCRRFGREGARIAALDVDSPGLARIKEELTGNRMEVRTYLCDVTRKDDCQDAIKQVIQDFGAVDVLINNAGVAHRSPFIRTRPEVLEKIIAISLLGTIYCTSAAISSLVQNKGMVIGISSIAGFAPLCGRTGYAAAKHGMAGFLNTLRTELEGDGVSVMLVYATYIATNIDQNALDGEGNRNSHEKIASGKVLMPEEAADSIFRAAMQKERQLLLGDNAQAAWGLYHSDPLAFEEIMMATNRYVLEQ